VGGGRGDAAGFRRFGGGFAHVYEVRGSCMAPGDVPPNRGVWVVLVEEMVEAAI